MRETALITMAAVIASAAYVSGIALSSPLCGVLCLVMGLCSCLFPDEALLFLVGFAALGRTPSSQILSFQLFSGLKIALVLIFSLVWLMRLHRTRPVIIFPAWLKVILCGWVILGSLSLFYSQDPLDSSAHVAACLAGMAFFYVVWNSEDAVHKKLAVVALICAVGVTGLSFLQYVALKYRIFEPLWDFILAPREILFIQLDWSPIGDHFYRVCGSFPHPNTLGTYYYLAIPFVAASMTMNSLGQWGRRILAGVFVFMLFGLYAANCRAGVIAIGISLAYLSVHRGCRWLIAVGTVSLLGLVIGYLSDPEGVVKYFQTIGRTEHGISSRGTIWENAGNLFERNPLLGLGPGQFVAHYNNDFGLFIFDNPDEIVEQAFLLQMEREDMIQGYHAHNTPLQLICEYGIFALPLFLAGIFGVIVSSEKNALNRPVGSFGRAMALGSASFCTSYLVASIFDSYVTFTTVGLIFLGGPLIAIGLRSA